MNRICFLDLETTGLDPDRHEVWEIGVIVRDRDGDHDHLWRIEPDLAKADPNGLRIGRYYERTTGLRHSGEDAWNVAPGVWNKSKEVGDVWSGPAAVAAKLARLLDGTHIVGAVPSFDAEFLKRFLPANGQAYTAHYHLHCVETMALGHLKALDVAVDFGTNSDSLSSLLGVDPAKYDRHTALGDARWVRDQYDAIMGVRADADA